MTDLSQLDDKELIEELERRKQERLRQQPPQIANILNFSPLVIMCQNYTIDVWENGWSGADEDLKHYIFETAMSCVYGHDIFQKLNQRDRSLHDNQTR